MDDNKMMNKFTKRIKKLERKCNKTQGNIFTLALITSMFAVITLDKIVNLEQDIDELNSQINACRSKDEKEE